MYVLVTILAYIIEDIRFNVDRPTVHVELLTPSVAQLNRQPDNANT